ncbi:Long-chain-fatty-acid--CoA ligase [Minicystis rosea]|nr:Long-chain-fatty-acid--CoA ligase [Minicystis rosea]
MAHDTIPRRLFNQAKARPAAPAYHHKIDGRYQPTTWGAYADLVKRAGKALLAKDLQGTVSILGFNRPEWVILDVAAMATGGAPAGIYTTCSAEEVRYIVNHSESKVVLVENESQWQKVLRELPNLPLVRQVVLMSGAPRVDHPLAVTWEEFLAQGDGVSDERFFAKLDALEPGGLATLIYTSGTTGPPKGVMLSHRNLTWTSDAARGLTSAKITDVAISYLPLSHIAEQVFSVHGHISAGYELYFAESIEKVPDNLKEVQPTIFFGVPRIWEKLHAGITQKLAEAPRARKSIAETAMRIGRAYHGEKNAGRAPSPFLELAHGVAYKLVWQKLKPAIGLGRARFCVSGAAPIAPTVLEFFTGLDLVVYEVYGQSEDTGPTSITLPGNNKVGTVGPPLTGVEVRFGDDGEILVRGPNVFLGYFKEPQATADALQDGWLCSGDLGKLDERGNLVITGRKKEIIITAGGKNITPKNIESALKEHPLIAEAVVIGDRRKYLTVLLILDAEAIARFAKEKGGQASVDAPEVRAEIQRAIDDVNAQLARVETVKKFTILPQPFSIDGGELTPTLKVKRKVVHDKYAREIDAMYAGDRDG